jgi:penicillin-binding protein 2
MVGLLLLGFWKLQVVDSDKYGQMAERNRVRSIPIIAPRGRMLDRDGRVLVDNYPSFSILLLRDDPALIDKNLPTISDGLGIPLSDLKDQLESTKNLPKFQPIVIKPEATNADVAYIESHRSHNPLLEMLMVQRQYNDILTGTDGMRRVVVNSVGKEVKELGRLSEQEPIPGKQIQLTIDYDLQQVAEQSLGARPGAVVALDPRTGEVLAMVSRPTPDPNDFAIRVSADEWKSLNDDPLHPLLNRAIQAQLAPGSVFKIVTATAMLEDHVPEQGFTTFCPGYGTFFGRQYHCWVYYAKTGAKSHGVLSLHDAILKSCDVFFYNVGMRLGIDRLSYYGTKLGIGHRTGIDLPSEEPGLMPSQEWVERTFHRKWYAGEVISVATGQGAVTTTPLQLARLIGGIASGGVFKQPHMLKDAQTVGEERFHISEPTIEKITDAMYGVVNEPGGTGGQLKLAGIEFSGKSGTAQVIGYGTRDRVGKEKKFEDNAWFVGYAPRRDPEIVVSVLVQESGKHGGEASGPVARDIIKAYYDKKAKKTQGQLTADDKRYDLGHGAAAAAATIHPQPFVKSAATTAVVPAQAVSADQRR